MPNKIILNEKFVEISHDQTNNIAVARWKGFLKLENLAPGLNALLDIVKKNNSKNHISDQRELKVLSKEVQDSLTGNFLPTLEKKGIKKLAIITSEDVFAIASVNKVNSSTMLGNMEIKPFNTERDSIDWINS